MAEENNIIWAISNRQDDRVVIFERDDRHPGGEAFLGGSTPDQVFKTPEIERLMHEGLIVEIPEPPESRKKPIPIAPADSGVRPAMPGQPVKLGRQMDEELVPAGALKKVQAEQASQPKEIRSKATVPPAPTSQKESSRS
jgi:hypothetical protein